jgi:hypothetical protein
MNLQDVWVPTNQIPWFWLNDHAGRDQTERPGVDQLMEVQAVSVRDLEVRETTTRPIPAG